MRRGTIAASRGILATDRADGAIDRGVLAWLRRLPSPIVPSILVIFVLVSVMAKWYAAIPAALLVLGFVGWLTLATWSELSSRGRNVRIAFLFAVALVLAYQLLRLA